MDHMYAPWRTHYFTEKKQGCIFCKISKQANKDTEHHVLYRDAHCFIVMNLYPYAPAHIMVIPHFHTDAVEALSTEVWLHVSAIVQSCVRMLKNGIGAQGVNLGMNLGKSGGAGIAEHIHYHVLPRWQGDTNFITTIADTRVYGSDFEEIYSRLKKLIPEYIGC